MSLTDIIREEIAESGPISIERYMELALLHPEFGYYTGRDPLGLQGDFITSPEISQIFGELIGLWCADMWAQLGEQDMAIIELGPGRGTLMSDALRAAAIMPDFPRRSTVHLVEASPVLANAQYHALKDIHPKITWHNDVSNLPKKPCIVIANEFFDAMPIKQFVKTSSGLQERLVDYDAEKASFTYTLKTAGLSLAKGNDGLEEGRILETSPASKQVMMQLSDHLREQGGAMLVVDYGYVGEGYIDSLQAVKGHSFHSVLDAPGTADLTAHVNFSTLMEIAEDKGLAAHGLVEQGKFLDRLGGEIRLEKLLARASKEQQDMLISGYKRLTSPTEMGDLFKVMATLSAHDITPAGFDA